MTPLEEYVHSDDGAFEWREVASYNFDGVTVYMINMTSQYYQDGETCHICLRVTCRHVTNLCEIKLFAANSFELPIGYLFLHVKP